jgi:hypothetical protein
LCRAASTDPLAIVSFKAPSPTTEEILIILPYLRFFALLPDPKSWAVYSTMNME